MAKQQIINVGQLPNDGAGDTLRIAFSKINNNFANVSILDETINLPIIKLTGAQNEHPNTIIKYAFDCVNSNFAKLASLCPTMEVVALRTTTNVDGDSLRTAFTKINNNFANLFLLTETATIVPTIPEISKFSYVPIVSTDIENVPVSTTLVTTSSPFADYLTASSSQEIINIGALPNDGTGDPLRTAFDKINNNFSNLFATASSPSIATTSGNVAGQVIYSTEIIGFSQAQFVIRSSDDSTNSQNITISAQLSNDNASVQFSAYGTTFIGNAVCRYDMEVDSANVRILCDPLVNGNLTHLVFTQLMAQV